MTSQRNVFDSKFIWNISQVQRNLGVSREVARNAITAVNTKLNKEGKFVIGFNRAPKQLILEVLSVTDYEEQRFIR